MVVISQKAFNDDMGRYIDRIRRSSSSPVSRRISFFRGFMDEDVPEMAANKVHVEYERPSFLRKVITWRRRVKLDEAEAEMSEAEKAEVEELEGEIEALEDEESQLEEMEEELEERKQGLMSRLFSKIGWSSSQAYDDEAFDEAGFEEALAPEMDEDVKRVLKITHSWIEKLPPRHIKAFKGSKDFEDYKSVLLKYGLVKEK